MAQLNPPNMLIGNMTVLILMSKLIQELIKQESFDYIPGYIL